MIDFNNPQQKKADNSIILGLFLSLIIIVLIALFAIGAMLNKPQDTNTNTKKTNNITNLKDQGKLQKFSSYKELSAYLQRIDQKNNNFITGNLLRQGAIERGIDNLASPIATKELVSPGQTEPGAETDIEDFSQTNIQVAGVDEADIIKTDGQYIYIVNGQDLIIVKAEPAKEAKIISRTSLKVRAQNLYIKDQYVAVFGNDYNLSNRKHVDFIIPPVNFTFIKIYDTNDKANPQLIREINFEGNYANSRLIGDYLYFLTTKYPDVWAEDILPRVIDNDKLTCSNNQLGKDGCPEVFYFKIPDPNQQITLVSAINIKNPKQPIKQQAYLLNGMGNIYVSKKALYITTTKYLDEGQLLMQLTIELIKPRLEERLKNKIAKISQTDPDVLNDTEKLNKIYSIAEYYIRSLSPAEQKDISIEINRLAREKIKTMETELEKTVIHKISIDKGELKNTAQGEVPGMVLNQFSMDESDGYFRIATTRNRRWSRFFEQANESYNNLYILDSNLNIVGKVEHLAPNERIYAVRFMQNRAYMVTFRQIDPLFVIDLSQPDKPKVLGQLKIPGYSNYLHPYNNNLLIGLGQDTSTNEWGGVRNEGVKLSLFDVSDVANPKEIGSFIFSESNSHSLAESDHKAFLFSKEKNLLVIPVNAWGSRNNEKNYSAAFVFNVNEKGFKLKGRVDHNLPPANCKTEQCAEAVNFYDRNAQVLRSLYIDNNLYTLSTRYLKINNLADLKELKSLIISEETYSPKPYPEPVPEPMPLRPPTKIETQIEEGIEN